MPAPGPRGPRTATPRRGIGTGRREVARLEPGPAGSRPDLLVALVIPGDDDATLSREAAIVLAGTMPGAQWDIRDDYDHFCHVRQARAGREPGGPAGGDGTAG